jgi:fructokinase
MSFKVIGIGEVLWDLLPAGKQLGGAPANFAYHAHALGASGSAITRIGEDTLGLEILARFKELGLPDKTVQVDDQSPTGTVTVTLSKEGVPHFTIHENVAWDRLHATKNALEMVQNADAVCFGSLAQRNPISHVAIQRLVGAAPEQALKIFDVNLRQSFYSPEIIEQSLCLASVFKLNDSELPIIAQMFATGRTAKAQIEELAVKFQLRLVALTRGSEGSLLFQDGLWSEQRPIPVKIVDTVGAGDSFTAALALGLLNGMDLDEMHELAAEIAAYVCSQAGATPLLPPSLRNRFSKLNNEETVVTSRPIPVRSEQLKSK